MLDTLLATIAPHLCFGCGKTGTVLCDNCKYNITSEPFAACIVCGRPAGYENLCQGCHTGYSRAWCVGQRTEVLKRLLDAYKFERVQAASKVLAELLSERLGRLPPSAVIVPVPTISAHIRQRGYDHMAAIAWHLVRLQAVPAVPLLARRSSTVQRGAGRAQRQRQAEQAYRLQRTPDPGATYVLIDDITTTGATLNAAARTLRQGGARAVWAAVLASQPLD